MTAMRNVLLLTAAVLIAGLFYVPNEAKRKQPRKRVYIKVVGFEDCPEYAGKSQNKLTNVTINYKSAGVDGVLFVNQSGIPPKLMLSFLSEKCQTLDDRNCERFFTTVLDFCKIALDRGQFYSQAFRAIHPPLRCPIKQGVYTIKNSTLSYSDIANMLKIIPEEYYYSYWKFTLKVFPPGKPKSVISCLNYVFTGASAKD